MLQAFVDTKGQLVYIMKKVIIYYW